ncbi:MAG: PRC-barrel domain-containing protein [Melioribacteraceae bacterium]|nr:PRC-barrel domain-containing protein [Melioribacteraceae bacterium]
MTDQTRNLFYLKELSDYKVASDYCDVRGWDVLDINNRNIGKVTSLLVNKIAERVVYLDVEVDKTLIEDGYNTYQTPASDGVHGFLNKEGDDHIIVPIGMVSLDEENKQVHTNQINYATFAKARRFSKVDVIDPDYELFLFRHYLGDVPTDSIILDDKFYSRKEFENSLLSKKIK